jgi:L-threonylcarbamoyladenylate synthase
MRVVRVHAERPEQAVIDEAVQVLRAGGLVAFPTETVYGLGARAADEGAVRKVFETKGRPSGHPLIAHVLAVSEAKALARDWPAAADALARAFWPGPLTLVVPRAASVSDRITGGGDSIAVRAPSHPVARALLEALGEAVVAPSANKYQTLSPTRAEHVVASLGDADVLVLDGGPCPGGIESTVVDARVVPPVVLRPGGVSVDALRSVIREVVFAPDEVAAGEVRASPGMDARHYAPVARLVVAHSRDAAIALASEMGAALVVIGPCDVAGAHVLAKDPEQASRELYSLLHSIDASGASVIVVEAPPAEPGWEAIADRLARASR